MRTVGALLYCQQPIAIPAFSHINDSSPRVAVLSFQLWLGLPRGHFPSPYHKAHICKTVMSMRSAAASTAAERRFVSISWRQFAELDTLYQFPTARSANCRWHVKCFRCITGTSRRVMAGSFGGPILLCSWAAERPRRDAAWGSGCLR
jgi:hypothetical protein